jgi:HSP20 family protein
LADNVLTISGEKKFEEKKDDRKYHRVERSYGAFRRSFTLGAPVQGDRIKASFKDGILEVTLPKSEEAKPREIDIQVG